MKIAKQSVELLWITPDPEKQIEIAGRTCYKSEDKITPDSARDFCRQMRQSGHHAMLEHACASFRIITDRGITHEIVRHRLASYAQESTRYCNYSKDKFGNECTFIEPPGLNTETFRVRRGDDPLFDVPKNDYEIWLNSCEDAEENYFELLDRDIPAQIARAVLPNCLKTEIVMTCNLREWRHFITLRGSKAAHPQIRLIAWGICDILMVYAPSVFEDLVQYPGERE